MRTPGNTKSGSRRETADPAEGGLGLRKRSSWESSSSARRRHAASVRIRWGFRMSAKVDRWRENLNAFVVYVLLTDFSLLHAREVWVRYPYATPFLYVPWSVRQVEAEALTTKARKAAEAAAAAAAELEMSRRPRPSVTRRFSQDSAVGSGWDADGSVHGVWVRRGSSGSLSSSPVTRATESAVGSGAREAEPLPNFLESSPPGEAATAPTPTVRESTSPRARDTGGDGTAGEAEVQAEQEDVASTKAGVVTEKPPKTPMGASRGREEVTRSRWRNYNGSSTSATDRNSFEARAMPPRVESRVDSSARSSAETGHRRPRSKSGSVVVDNEGLLVRKYTVRFRQPP